MHDAHSNSPALRCYDIVIVGGGLVGSLMALTLAQQKRWRIAVIEKSALSNDTLDSLQHPSFDARNTALSNGSCELLHQLGLWHFLKQHAEPICSIDVNDQGGFGSVEIEARAEQVSALGYVIENRWIGHAVQAALLQAHQVDYIDESRVNYLTPLNTGYSLEIERAHNVESVTAHLLVVADGADSATCGLLGIGFRVSSYAQYGIVTALKLRQPHHGLAVERFTPFGPLALLPQTEQRWGVTWCVSDGESETVMALNDQAFLQALSVASGARIPHIEKVGQRFSYPLRRVVADEQIRPHLVVLGNAAHALHPVAGQGLNMALRDVVVLARHLHATAQAGRMLGNFADLQAYYNERESDQSWTIHFSDKLTRIFSSPSSSLRLARSLGMTLFDVFPGAKHGLARYAMGRSVSMRIPGPSL